MLHEKANLHFFDLDFTTYIQEGGNCIDIDVEQMAGVVKNSTLKTQNDTLLDSVYTYFSMREDSTKHIKIANFCFILW